MNATPALPVSHQRARPLLGTLVEIAASGTTAEHVQHAIDTAFAAVETVHRLMSYHAADSDVSRLNRQPVDTPLEIDPHTWEVLQTAQMLSTASQGLFDVTIAPHLVTLGFLPCGTASDNAAPSGNWRHIRLLPDYQVTLARPVQIDLSGIAKGYAVDQAIAALRQAGIFAGRVNAGGDLRLFGPEAQTIHVRHPLEPTRLIPVLQLQDGAVATSAGYYNQRRHNGRDIMPIIHPETGTACSSTRSVSVLAPSCMLADALTKIVHADSDAARLILPRFQAQAMLLDGKQPDAPCRLIPAPPLATLHHEYSHA